MTNIMMLSVWSTNFTVNESKVKKTSEESGGQAG